MIRLFITKIEEISLDRACELTSKRAEKVARLKFEDDKKRCIAGGLFINRFLNGAKISENEFGKPVADNGIYFNISHSGDYVLFALSDKSIGCDIEKRKNVEPLRLGKIVFCQSELDYIASSSEPVVAFYKLWTRKESLLKCIGEGFHRSSKSVDVTQPFCFENGVKYSFKECNFDGYAVSLCSAGDEFPEEIEYIEL